MSGGPIPEPDVQFGPGMKHFRLSAEDRRWMKRRLLASFAGLTLLSAACVGLQLSPRPAPIPSMSSAPSTLDEATLESIVTEPPPEVIAASSGSRSIPPTGWRKTSRGWEHVADWPPAARISTRPSLNELIKHQEAKEPAWLRQAFNFLNQVPPVTIAVVQLIAIGVIAQLGSRKGKGRIGTERNVEAASS